MLFITEAIGYKFGTRFYSFLDLVQATAQQLCTCIVDEPPIMHTMPKLYILLLATVVYNEWNELQTCHFANCPTLCIYSATAT